MSETATSYVNKTPEGGWRVAGTRVSLDSIVHAYWEGRLTEAIAADFPTLTLEKVHGSIAFYLHHQEEVDGYLKAQDTQWQQFQQESAARHGPLLRRIRASTRSQVPPEK